MKNNLVLFDIDWTLVKGSIPAHKDSFAYGFSKVYNVDASIDDVAPCSGKTDKQIIFEVLQKKGIERNAIQKHLDRMFASMIEYSKNEFLQTEVIVLSGVKDFLETLKKYDIAIGVLTGSIEEIARIKLERAKLLGYFSVGAYGNETEKRYELVKIAQDRAEKIFGSSFSNQNTYLVGDSPRDVQCGKESNVVIIAVASGNYKKEELQSAGADIVLSNLKEYNKAIEFMKLEK